MSELIKFKNVKKTYNIGEKSFNALDGVDFSIDKGEFVVILGPSGAGKSTLLNILGGMDSATSGKITIGDEEISKYNDKELTNYRAENIGFIFQFYNILPTLTVLENVELINDVVKNPKDAKEILKRVGLEKHYNKFPNQLSGGEQQRVALARALVNNPSMLIADEPTGNLDPDTAWEIMNLLNDINMRGTTVVVATHAKDIVDKMKKRVIHISKGKIIRDDKKGGYDCEI